MKIDKWTLITPVSFILFVASLFLLKDTNLIIALTLSVTLHELAHGVMLRAYNIPFHLVFIPLLGAGCLPSDLKLLRTLPKSGMAIMAMAGPIINLMLLLLGLAFVLGGWQPELGKKLYEINTILMIVNLAPIGPLDGFKIANAISQSLKSLPAKIITGIYYTITGVAGLFYFFGNGHLPQSNITIFVCLVVAIFFSLTTFATTSTDKESPAMGPKTAFAYFTAFALLTIPSILWLVNVLSTLL